MASHPPEPRRATYDGVPEWAARELDVSRCDGDGPTEVKARSLWLSLDRRLAVTLCDHHTRRHGAALVADGWTCVVHRPVPVTVPTR